MFPERALSTCFQIYPDFLAFAKQDFRQFGEELKSDDAGVKISVSIVLEIN
jgi:hypothetical protein